MIHADARMALADLLPDVGQPKRACGQAVRLYGFDRLAFRPRSPETERGCSAEGGRETWRWTFRHGETAPFSLRCG